MSYSQSYAVGSDSSTDSRAHSLLRRGCVPTHPGYSLRWSAWVPPSQNGSLSCAGKCAARGHCCAGDTSRCASTPCAAAAARYVQQCVPQHHAAALARALRCAAAEAVREPSSAAVGGQLSSAKSSESLPQCGYRTDRLQTTGGRNAADVVVAQSTHRVRSYQQPSCAMGCTIAETDAAATLDWYVSTSAHGSCTVRVLRAC